ncbi:MAG: hypothetical protein LW768_07920 [Rubrivivax sp.]|jgi:hypothetical protein|nr:hypothetical protein [Rubrivivax sp.]
MATFSGEMLDQIRDWVESGCICVKTHVVFRWQKTYPRTLCVVFEQPTINGRVYDWACLDVHYNKFTGGFVALGGFWIRGIDDHDLRPEQDCKGGALARMYGIFKGKAAVDLADESAYRTYKDLMFELFPKYT